jgi:hypothetical protein
MSPFRKDLALNSNGIHKNDENTLTFCLFPFNNIFKKKKKKKGDP